MTEFQLQPMSQIVIRLDRDGVVLDFENALAGSGLKELRCRRGTSAHRCLHANCKDRECDLREMLQVALSRVEKARILEWEHQSTHNRRMLRLHLRHAHRRAKTWATLTVTDITDVRMWSGAMRDAYEAMSGMISRPDVERAVLVRNVDRKLRNLSGELIIAQEIERRRISSDLHDGLGQWLSMAKLSIEAGLARPEDSAASSDFHRAIAHIQRAIQETRAIARNLKFSPLEEYGLVPTLELLCHALQQAKPQIGLSFEVGGDSILMSQDQAVALTRILQESLNNLAKHSAATKASVSVEFELTRTTLVVRDNGVGFDVPAAAIPSAVSGFGLTSMRDRVNQTNGRLQINSRSGSGTEIVAAWEHA